MSVRRLARRACLVGLSGVLAAGCMGHDASSGRGGGLAADAAVRMPVRPLAEADLDNPRVHPRVLALARTGADVLTLTLEIVNPDRGQGVRPGAMLAGPDGQEAFGGIALLDEARQRLYFVMRNAQGRVAGSGEPGGIEPGAAATVQIRFPAPSPDATRLTVLLPGRAPLGGVPVSGPAGGTARGAQSY